MKRKYSIFSLVVGSIWFVFCFRLYEKAQDNISMWVAVEKELIRKIRRI